jgi:hypothetical protein
LPLKRFHFVGGKLFSDDEGDETEVCKWLRQQSKDFYAAGFDALVKRWKKCINVDGGYVPGFNIIRFTFYIPL